MAPLFNLPTCRGEYGEANLFSPFVTASESNYFYRTAKKIRLPISLICSLLHIFGPSAGLHPRTRAVFVLYNAFNDRCVYSTYLRGGPRRGADLKEFVGGERGGSEDKVSSPHSHPGAFFQGGCLLPRAPAATGANNSRRPLRGRPASSGSRAVVCGCLLLVSHAVVCEDKEFSLSRALRDDSPHNHPGAFFQEGRLLPRAPAATGANNSRRPLRGRPASSGSRGVVCGCLLLVSHAVAVGEKDSL